MAKRKSSGGVDGRLKLPVSFGQVSLGDATGRLGLTIDRTKIDVETALGTFCGRRVTGTVLVGDSDPDQTSFLGDIRFKVASVFDVKRLGVSPKEFSLGLTFSLAEIDVSDLAHFSKKNGMIVVDMSAQLPEKEARAKKNGEDDPDEDL